MFSKNIFHSFQEIFQPNILRNYPGYFAMQVSKRHAQSFGTHIKCTDEIVRKHINTL